MTTSAIMTGKTTLSTKAKARKRQGARPLTVFAVVTMGDGVCGSTSVISLEARLKAPADVYYPVEIDYGR